MPEAAEVQSLGDATGDQRAELHELIAGKAVDDEWRKRFYRAVYAANGLSRRAASDALIYLRSLADKGHQPTHAIPAQRDALRGLMRSRIVPTALSKMFMRRYENRELTYIEADRAVREWLRMPLRPFILAANAERRSGWQAPDGYFTLLRQDGSPRCYRIYTLDATGARAVEQITGERRSQRRKIYGYQATLVMREIAADPAEAARLYGRTRRRCSACNTPIDDETKPGYEHGYGPDCWAARQAAAAETRAPE